MTDKKCDDEGPETGTFFAVAVGTTPGVYATLEAATAAAGSVPIPLVKPCKTRTEAREFVKLFTTPPGERLAVVYVDGACSCNGTSRAKAGVGVFWDVGDARNVSKTVEGAHTNNVAELEAAWWAFKAIAADKHYLTTRYCVVTDSTYVQNILTRWYKAWEARGWVGSGGGVVKNLELVQRVYAAYECVMDRTNVAHVRGHKGILGNVRADELAVAGIAAGSAT